MKKIKFMVVHPGEPAAGIRGYSDEVEVIVDSGDPGGDPGEFEWFMQNCLATWYDGAKVTLEGEKCTGSKSEN